jgi:hypothetical protein
MIRHLAGFSAVAVLAIAASHRFLRHLTPGFRGVNEGED